jgi:hypothetical protein
MQAVRRMSAIGIGRLKAESQLPVLRRFVVEVPWPTGQACAWSLQQMTGERPEFSLELVTTSSDWFLTPLSGERATETD